jgi:hypothetical protein
VAPLVDPLSLANTEWACPAERGIAIVCGGLR